MSSKRQQKRKQRESFDPNVTKINPAAAFASTKRRGSNVEITTSRKKQKITAATMDNALKSQFHDYIFDQIAASTNTTDTFSSLISLKKMPRVVIQAEDSIKADRGTISNYLRGLPQSNISLFVNYAKKNFDDIVEEVEATPSASSAGPSTAPPEPRPSTSTSTSTSISTSTSTSTSKLIFTEDEDDGDLRGCTASTLSILRQDMLPEAQAHINHTLEQTLARVSDYIVDFSAQVRKLLLLFRDHTFELDQNSVTFPLVAPLSSNALLPTDFLPNDVQLPPHWPSKLLDSKKYEHAFGQLFTLQHFSRIHATYYGQIGTKTASPYHDAMVTALPKTDGNEAASRQLSPHAMRKAYDKFSTNFANMWSGGNRFAGLLDRLLLHLLNAHLVHRAQRERKDKDTAQTPSLQQQTDTQYTFGSKSKGTVKKIIEKEEKNVQRHLNKGNHDKAEECRRRISNYKATQIREV